MSKISSRVNIAIVLGAGASIPPLTSQQGLVEELFRASTQPRIQPAQRYLRHAFPGLREGTVGSDNIRFEDIVGPLEIAESEEYWYHFGAQGKGQTLLTNREVLDSLDTWVAMTLDPQNIPKPPTGRDRESARKKQQFLAFYAPGEAATLSYARLLHFLSETGLLDQTAFLSMNYDILLDRALYASGTHVPDYWIDAFYDVPKPDTSKGEQHSGVLLLKLHGSLNWRVCNNCHFLRNLKEFVAWPKDKCTDCGAFTARPMLIRPTLLKDFRHRVWRDVWRKAGHVLASASRWVFVGYSLPMADVWMLRLLAQSARSGGISPWDRKITVVNRDSRVRQRFSFLFPKMDFRKEDFDSWVATSRSQGQLA